MRKIILAAILVSSSVLSGCAGCFIVPEVVAEQNTRMTKLGVALRTAAASGTPNVLSKASEKEYQDSYGVSTLKIYNNCDITDRSVVMQMAAYQRDEFRMKAEVSARVNAEARK